MSAHELMMSASQVLIMPSQPHVDAKYPLSVWSKHAHIVPHREECLMLPDEEDHVSSASASGIASDGEKTLSTKVYW